MEILVGRERRRRWGLDEKLRIVAESQEAGASVREVAGRNDVYPSLLHNWRRQVREGRLGARLPAQFMPVRLTKPIQGAAPASPSATKPNPTEMIEIELPDGCRLRVGNGVNTAQLRRVISVLRG